MTTVAIQGNEGSFHDQAARTFFGDEYEMKTCLTFRDVFESVSDGDTEYGVVAIENSLHGSINPVYRLLAEKKLWVCGEIRLRIQLHLIGSKQNTAGDFSKITRVLSQAEAISQCEEWLHDHLPHIVVEESNDTAGSVRTIVEQDNPEAAAIAGEMAASTYGGITLAAPINDDPANYTRFFILQKHPTKNSSANRTSIIMTEKDPDNVGSLYDALGVFSSLGINLTKLDSHTLPGRTRRYAFYIDFDENVDTEHGKNAIKNIENLGWDVVVLGTYEKTEH